MPVVQHDLAAGEPVAEAAEKAPPAARPADAPKRRGPRREQVVDYLREAITLGKLADGDRLIEGAIARDLETSRGPVREALRQLEHEGLVVSFPYRGAVVTGVSEEEIAEVLIPIRLTLERFSFLKALERMNDGDFAELAKEVWQMQQAAQAGDLARSVEADIRYHELVLDRSGQPHTAQIWRSVAPRIRAYFFRWGRNADLAVIALEHAALLKTLQTRDRDQVIAAVERHSTERTPAPAGATA
jgi:DNA-binding GntR family transcriptional regulator